LVPAHQKPGKPGISRKPGKPRRLAPLTAVLCLLIGAAFGSYALARGGAPETVSLSSASGAGASVQDVAIYGCLKSGKLSQVSVTAAPKCSAKSTSVHWSVPSQSVGVAGHSVTVYACLAMGRPTHLAVASATKCAANTVPAHYPARFGSTVLAGQHVTVNACMAWGTLTHVTVDGASKCPAHTIPAHWPALFTPPSSPAPVTSKSPSADPTSSSANPVTSKSPSADPTSSSPAPVTTTTAPASTPPTSPSTGTSSSGSATPSGTACVTSADKGVCGPYTYAGITSPNGQGTNVIQDVWNPISGASQTLTSYNPGDWSVSANMPASNKAVVSYPDDQQIYTLSNGNPDPLSNFNSITSSYNESGPSTGDYEAAYDMWANNGSIEIMIWVDNHGQTPAGSVVANPTIGGIGYSVYKAGSTVSMVLNSQASSGTVDLLAALNWLKSSGDEPSDLAINQIDFGWEICSTGGSTQKFTMNSFTIKSS
jgi:hypothetical protein